MPLVPFMTFIDVSKGKADTSFFDFSDAFEFSEDASPDADAIVSCYY